MQYLQTRCKQNMQHCCCTQKLSETACIQVNRITQLAPCWINRSFEENRSAAAFQTSCQVDQPTCACAMNGVMPCTFSVRPATVSSSASWLHLDASCSRDLVPSPQTSLHARSHSSIPAGQLPFQGSVLKPHSSPAPSGAGLSLTRFLPL
jgi:hypothetical protein